MTVLQFATVLLTSLSFMGLGVGGCTAQRNFEPEAPDPPAQGTTSQSSPAVPYVPSPDEVKQLNK